jgi:hypothetical protein
MCVRDVDFAFSTIFRLDIGTVSTMLYFFFTFLILLNILAEGVTPNIPLGEVRQPFEIFGNFTQEDIGGGSIEVHSRGHDNVSNPDDIDRFLNGD